MQFSSISKCLIKYKFYFKSLNEEFYASSVIKEIIDSETEKSKHYHLIKITEEKKFRN